MTESLVIDPRFCGPPGVGNGGYVSGRLAAYLGGQADVTLRQPTPVATPLAVERDGDRSVRIWHGSTLIAEATAARGGLDMELPGPVSVDEARAAAARCRLRTHPEEHPFPGCFGCGPDRAPGDGLGVLAGRVAGRDLSADIWHPDLALADPAGDIPAEIWCAALDCTGGVAALWDVVPGSAPSVLGRFAIRQTGPVRAGKPHIATGWRLSADGRKMLAGSALFTVAGQAVAIARATWIRLA